MRLQVFIILAFITTISFAQDIKTPAGYTVLEKVSGDLDKDAVDETVIVYDTGISSEFGTIREIQIFKQVNGSWQLWQSSKNAVLKSEEGGMMGDPFESVDIKNGILSITHFGGSSWKWSTTDKYRFQNKEFQLIGYNGTYGKPCEYWLTTDFNLSTGKLIYKKEPEHCEENSSSEVYKPESETFIKRGILLDLNNRHAKEIKVISPKNKYEIYL